MNKKDFKFYKDFYDNNRIALMQYKSLRKNFSKLVRSVLGKNYYNMELDVYRSDQACCEDIAKKANYTWFQRLLNL